jgi:hypothetical protein
MKPVETNFRPQTDIWNHAPSRTIQDTEKKAWLLARCFISFLVPDPQQVLPWSASAANRSPGCCGALYYRSCRLEHSVYHLVLIIQVQFSHVLRCNICDWHGDRTDRWEYIAYLSNLLCRVLACLCFQDSRTITTYRPRKDSTVLVRGTDAVSSPSQKVIPRFGAESMQRLRDTWSLTKFSCKTMLGPPFVKQFER